MRVSSKGVCGLESRELACWVPLLRQRIEVRIWG